MEVGGVDFDESQVGIGVAANNCGVEVAVIV